MAKVIFTNHAISRFKERFRLHFNRSVFERRDVTIWKLNQLFTNSHIDQKWKRSPFYANKVQIKHGHEMVVFKYNHLMYFICLKSGDDYVVKTIVRNFDPVGN